MQKCWAEEGAYFGVVKMAENVQLAGVESGPEVGFLLPTPLHPQAWRQSDRHHNKIGNRTGEF